MHLDSCPNRPVILEDDKEINVKIDELLERHKILKEEKKKAESSFECPYCEKTYESENLPHLLGCAQKNPDDNEKLIAYFSAN